MSGDNLTLRLEVTSVPEIVDLVQVITEHLGRMAHMKEEDLHGVALAVQECTVNAIKHGNKGRSDGAVRVEFTLSPRTEPTELVITVCDQGGGFNPEALNNPIAPESLLRTHGRGLFLMNQFMNEVSVSCSEDGETQVRMTKKIR